MYSHYLLYCFGCLIVVKRRKRCGICIGCTSEDCGNCNHCKDKPKFGGPGHKKQCCTQRKCRMMASATDEPVMKVYTALIPYHFQPLYDGFGGCWFISLQQARLHKENVAKSAECKVVRDKCTPVIAK